MFENIKKMAAELEAFLSEEDAKIKAADKLRDELERVPSWRIFTRKKLLRRYAAVVNSFKIG